MIRRLRAEAPEGDVLDQVADELQVFGYGDVGVCRSSPVAIYAVGVDEVSLYVYQIPFN